MDLVTVFRTYNTVEAQVICSRLQADGIQASVVDETAAMYLEAGTFTTGGVRVQVPDHQAAEARRVITGRDDHAAEN
ncbi:MAG: DUF2007 domain-containing protein [Verrucomicrobiota bacterium]|nr:DUF2007 domain-containing protein [Verrucomicrobiota bacterium]